MNNKISRLISTLLIIVMSIISLVGCGKETESNDPNLGVYTAFTGSMSGIEIDIADVYAGGFNIELKEKGKAKIDVDGSSANGKWTLDGEKFTFSGGGFDCEGTLKDGAMILDNVLGSGLTITLVNEAFLKSLSEDEGNYEVNEKVGADNTSILGLTDDILSEDEFDTSYAAKWEGTWFCSRTR